MGRLIKILKILWSPIKHYQVWYLNKLIDHIIFVFETEPIINIKVAQNIMSTTYRVNFFKRQFIIRFSEHIFYFKDGKHEVYEKILDYKNIKIPFLIDKIQKSKQFEEILNSLNDEFYKSVDYYHLFMIIEDDFKRSNPVDNYYDKRYRELLTKLCLDSCFFCQNKQNLQLDHFFIPKSKGGNFILKTYNGLFINNGIMLCDTCNKSKTAGTFRKFQDQIDYDHLKKIQFEMNKKINKIQILS